MADQLLPDISIPGAVTIDAAVTHIDDSPEMTARVRTAFANGDAVILPSAFAPAFLQTILTVCRRGAFATETIDRIGWRTVEERDVAGAAMRFALERPAFLRWVEAVAGCEPLTRLSGVVAEMAADTGQELGWHNDRTDETRDRRLAVTVHLSDAPYEGGHFEMRDERSGQMRVRAGALPPGSVMLFRIDGTLRHRVNRVTSGGPRRVFAGWLSV
jgi:hypothetical protein